MLPFFFSEKIAQQIFALKNFRKQRVLCFSIRFQGVEQACWGQLSENDPLFKDLAPIRGGQDDIFIPQKLQCFLKHNSQQMIGTQHAQELEVLGQVPKLLREASFSKEKCLWVKQRTHSSFESVQLSKKYEFTKIGKILGIETTRFISLCENHLFYFDEAKSNEFLGYCSIQNVYLQWLQLKKNKFLLIMSNGTEVSQFYFSTPEFWNQQRQELARFTVLLNFHQRFELLDQLGEGSFAKVYRVREYDTRIEYAAKMINKTTATASMIQMLSEEKRLLSYLKDSSYIYQFKEFYETNQEYVILMEYVPGVDLMSFIRMKLDVSISDIKYLLTNILMGIKDCHDNLIIHRDIKPQNIIVDVHSYQMKIIDFGLSLHLPSQTDNSNFKKCGTVGYMAPQVFDCKRKMYNQKCDIYSFGIIAHLLLFGTNPLKGKNYEETCFKNQKGKIDLNEEQIIENYGESCLSLLKRVLAVSVEDRYTAEQALMCSFLRESSGKSSVTTDDDRMRGSFD